MKLEEAYKILRRYQDCQDGYDFRSHIKAGLESIGEAIDVILQSQGLGNPITDCFRCRNHDTEGIRGCLANQVGECRRFEPEDVR